MEGTSLGPYRVLERLGAGGMGVVYLALDTRLGRRVALKLIEDDSTPSRDRQRLIHEARAAARLNHPQIAGVYDVLEHSGQICIVMEYAEGRSLSELVRRGPLAIDLAVSIGAQIAEALAYAHERGVIHRDVKPSNVHVTESGAAKLLDLGIASIAPSDTLSGNSDGTATHEAIRGTPAYMAPEQIGGSRADARGDIYSLGALLFELVTGRPPYPGKSFAEQAVALATSTVPRAASVNPAVPAVLDGIIQQALSHDPARRQPSANEVASQLRTLQSTLSSERTTESTRTRTRMPRWVRLAFGLMFCAAVAVLSGLLLFNRGRPAGDSSGLPQRTVVAVLPVNNITGDEATEGIGTAIASVLAANMSSLPGLTMLSRSDTSPYRSAREDIQRICRELGADLVVDLSAQSKSSAQLTMTAVLRGRTGGEAWSDTFEGDVFTVERKLLDGVALALQRAGAFRRPLVERDWSRIRKLPTTDAAALAEYSQGLLLLDRRGSVHDLERAADLFASAARRDQAFALAFAGLAEALAVRYQRTRDPQLAARALEAADTALGLNPEQSAVRVAMASVRYVAGRRHEAIQELQRALSAQPDNDEAYRLLGRALSEGGDVQGAIAALRQALVIRPDYWNHHFTLGYVLYSAGRLDEAAAEYKRTTELRPGYALAYQMLGTTYHRLGDVSKAIGYYEHAVSLGPTAGALANLGYFYFNAGRYEQAVRAYEEAVRLEGQEPVRHRNLADVYRRVGRQADANREYKAALTMAARILEVNPHDADAISLVALCEARLSRFEAAERHAAQALTVKQPPSREVLTRVAQAYALIGNTKASLATLGDAIKQGYRDASTDDEFDKIRDTVAFKALVTGNKGVREGSPR